ncbi:hypothetical protein MGMO_147c00040 [Methyloglobulus morosus KoM1]|uniref:PIN-like domain-containing protein n=1 Tax=Methyloglobulus morosus KoM1 TaxID=1116472 RepID=V5B568_9GAMM|nr:PIN domain-containing protein [Methyloglobulus morosus]ESS68365.1 hypothetical protein MGMO_147c00040 [Methyloglobulus morosus KoM1]
MEINEKKGRTNYIFIDYENVQPSSLSLPPDYPFKVLLFIGANQTKISVELAASMQELGKNAEYIKIEGNGKNALDFHVAFYLGKLFEKDPNGYFHIISKDSGFDLLIKHLRERRVLIQRYNQINDIPILKISNSKTLSEKTEEIVRFLINRGNAKPRKLENLSNAINALFMKTLDAEELNNLIKELIRRDLVVIDGSKVHYKLTSDEP